MSVEKLIYGKTPERPGNHAPPGFISSEYDEKIVRKQVSFLQESEKWDIKSMEEWQINKIRELLKHANKTVPYYRKLFKNIDFKPDDFCNLKDIEAIPFLTKEIIRENYDDLISEEYRNDDLSFMTTGGSTGDPMKIIMNKEYRSLNHANTRYYLMVAGYNPGGKKSIRLHGDSISDEKINIGEYWNIEGNRLTMSVHHLTEQTVKSYIEKINRFNPDYIHAYPSALVLLMNYVKKFNLNLCNTLNSIFTDSETIYEWQRNLIEETSNCKIFNTYGHTEGATLAITFPDSKMLNVIPQVGYQELIDKKQKPIIHENIDGEIVVTGFNNRVFPLIRYKTSDIASYAQKPTNFIRPYKLLNNVSGRVQDFIVSKNGDLIPIAPALFDYNFNWSGIDRFQIYQKVKGEITFNFVISKNSPFSKNNLKERLISGFTKILNDTFKVNANQVKNIPFTGRGKYRYVNQKITNLEQNFFN